VLANRDGVRRTVASPAVRTNGGIAARSFTASGAGGMLPDYAGKDELVGLLRVLPDLHEERERPITAWFPVRAQMPARVRLLLDFLKEEFQQRYGAPSSVR
jgi:DNA-binding transcriptional LysR family regulator